MSKKPTKKDLEFKLQQKDKQILDLQQTISDQGVRHAQMTKEAQNHFGHLRSQQQEYDVAVKKHKKNEGKLKDNMMLWKSAYYDLKDRTDDLAHRMDAVREMITENMENLPKDQKEKEKVVDSVLDKVLRYVVKLENKVFISVADAVEATLDRWNNGSRFKQVWDSFSPSTS